MSGIATFTPMPLYISDNASEKVKALVEEEGNPDLKLRVFVTGGGCSGFQYGFSFDEVTAEDDTLVSKDGWLWLWIRSVFSICRAQLLTMKRVCRVRALR